MWLPCRSNTENTHEDDGGQRFDPLSSKIASSGWGFFHNFDHLSMSVELWEKNNALMWKGTDSVSVLHTCILITLKRITCKEKTGVLVTVKGCKFVTYDPDWNLILLIYIDPDWNLILLIYSDAFCGVVMPQ